jgi:hypothetical protein
MIYMGDIGPPDLAGSNTVVAPDPEYAQLGLPSAYTIDTLKVHSLMDAAEVEVRLQRARCNDALKSVRNLLSAKALALKYKRKNIRGERSTTCAESALREHQEKVSRLSGDIIAQDRHYSISARMRLT